MRSVVDKMRMVIGISGSSGVIYGIRMLELLRTNTRTRDAFVDESLRSSQH